MAIYDIYPIPSTIFDSKSTCPEGTLSNCGGGAKGTLSGTEGTLSSCGTEGTLSSCGGGAEGTLSGTKCTLSNCGGDTKGTLSNCGGGTEGTLSGTKCTLSSCGSDTKCTLSGSSTEGTLSSCDSAPEGTLSGGSVSIDINEYIKKTFVPLKPIVPIMKDSIIGSYKFIRIIDSGTYGVVWEGIDTRTQNKVAIKVQCNNKDSDEESYKSAFRELRCLYSLHDIDNIVKLLDAFYCNSTLFFVLEYCEQTLHHLFITLRRSDDKVNVLKLIFKQILAGLIEINKKGYCHLDIKPKNILIDSSGTVKICDFSISCKLNEIRIGEEYQTAWYRSPEAVSNHLWGAYFKSNFDIGFNTDIWSIGCMFFEGMTRGEIFYRYDRSTQLHDAFKQKRFYNEDNYYINNKLSQYPLLVDFIKRCITYDHSVRPNAEQLLEHPFFN